MLWSGNRLEGERLDLIFRDGAHYEGECDSARLFHGRGAYRTADGRWLYDGSWERNCPTVGAARDSNGVLWRTAHDMGPWKWESGRVPQSWTRTAVTVTQQSPEAAPGTDEWSGVWTYEGVRRMEGFLRGLRPMVAVEMDFRGVQTAVTYDGERTLVESLAVTSRTVSSAAGLCGALQVRADPSPAMCYLRCA